MSDHGTRAHAHIIRDAEEGDLPGILEIFNEQIQTSAAIFLDEPVDIANRRAWLHESKAAGFPIFVAVPSNPPAVGDGNGASPNVLGFVSYGTLGTRSGYRFNVETTLYVHKSARRGGIGSALMRALVAHARKKGNVHTLIAITAEDNLASIRVHERFGFVRTGTMKEVGYKFGRWHDMMLLQLIFPGGPSDSK